MKLINTTNTDMNKIYVSPETIVIKVHVENPLTAPSTWSVDGGPTMPIGEDDGEDPSGAKKFNGTDWDMTEDNLY